MKRIWRVAMMTTSARALGLWVSVLVWVSLGTVDPLWGQCDVKDPGPECPRRPVSLIKDDLFTNPNGALFACAPDDGFCVGLLLSNQDGVSSQRQSIEGKPQGAIGSHAYLHVKDAPGVICACPGGPSQNTCGGACVSGFRAGNLHESQRASCSDCAELMINLRAMKDVAVDDDDDPDTPPVTKPLAYILVGQIRVRKAIDKSGDACSATLVGDETVPPFDFSFTFENNDHGSVTDGCL